MNWAWVVVGGTVGGLLGPVLRGQILRYSVDSGELWRTGCPRCQHRLVPGGWRAVATALPVTGVCPHCRQSVGPPPGVVEATSAAVLAVLTWRVGEVLPLLAFGWTFSLGVILAFVDWKVRRLPNQLTFAAAAGAGAVLTVAAATGDVRRLVQAVACALAVALCYLVLVLIRPSGMGLGDAKLALATGLVTGWVGPVTAVWGAVLGFFVAGGYGVFLLVTRRARLSDHIPHGPFMLLGAFAAVALTGV